MKLSLALILPTFLCFTAALPPFFWGRPTNGGFLHYRHDELEADTNTSTVTETYITQKVDHFSNNTDATYKQRYWYNSQFSKNNDIVFLMIQGESTASKTWITKPSYQYLQNAKKFGADVFMLEHRCFGLSNATQDLSYPAIKVCTMEQALQDIHSFIQYINNKHGYKNPKWITFGGSYPGALSALHRAEFPNDSVGAVASSAPMLWTLDFYQYAQVVESALKQTSESCAANVGKAFQKMQELSISSVGIKNLDSYFNLKPKFQSFNYTQSDIDNFFANVFSYFQGVVQYTDDGRSESTKILNVRNLCEKMNDNSEADLIKRVVNVVKWVNNVNGDSTQTFDNSYNDMIKSLRDTRYNNNQNGDDMSSARGWMWLSCNEFGVLQTTDQGRNIFQQTIPLNYYINMCTDVFGEDINIKLIRDNNDRIFRRFGGNRNYRATNVVLPNGSYDPWHVLGVTIADEKNHVTPLLIKKAAHCSDMYPEYDGEPEDLKANRDIIFKELQYFLGQS